VTCAVRALGFDPQFPIARGVPATAAWYREARWL
jgi:nucleoside-diphosphate-sugar epimerase